MTRDEFCNVCWNYYLVLEADCMSTERYVSFDLGDNNLYSVNVPTVLGNSMAFSVEYIKQYQAICSEIDVILKTICGELGNVTADNMKTGYTPTLLGDAFWGQVVNQKVLFKGTELQPFINWSSFPNYQAPAWWSPYNGVKHDRTNRYKEANLKNVLNALAGLYILENYLVKYIGDRDNERDVPNDVSHLFEMKNWQTRDTVAGKEFYAIRSDEMEDIVNQIMT